MPSGITCSVGNRPRAEACMGWVQAGGHLGRGLQSHRYEECGLEGMHRLSHLAGLTPHLTGRRMAIGVPERSP